jgi:hypothetical protein
MKVGIISTTARKHSGTMRARELYSVSPLFRYSLKYCEESYDQTYILSPQNGLIFPDETVEPNNLSLADKRKSEFKEWQEKVIRQIREQIPQGSELYFHAGNKYKTIIPLLPDYHCFNQTKNMGIGKQLKFYKNYFERSQND